MDRQYDGQMHVMVAPYIWGPTIHANYQFSVPRLDRRGGPGKVVGGKVLVGPSDYLPKLNTAGMLAFDVRKGDIMTLRRWHLYQRVDDGNDRNANPRLAGTRHASGDVQRVGARGDLIWEIAAGYTIAHGHNADLSSFVGIRDFPIALNADYNATISKRNIVTPTGTISNTQSTNDVIVGLRGRAFFSDRFYAAYYGDIGYGTNGNQTWEAYGGGGYAFEHGQTIVALWRALDYNSFPSGANVQKFNLSGPLIGYTFNL